MDADLRPIRPTERKRSEMEFEKEERKLFLGEASSAIQIFFSRAPVVDVIKLFLEKIPKI